MMTTRRPWLLLGLVAAALSPAASRPLDAQPAAKVYRIGMLEGAEVISNAENLAAFRDRLRGLGYVEGQHYVLELRSAEGRPQRLPDLAAELASLPVDVMVTRGSPAALAAKHATRTIPIVMASSGDPSAEGIAANLARPDGNVTGFHILVPLEVGATRLRLLKEAVPGAARVGILWNSVDIHGPLLVRETARVAPGLGVALKSLELPRAWPSRPGAAFDQVFEAAMMDQVDALIAVEGSVMFNERARLVAFAAMSRLPAIYGLREFVEAGGLMSYGTDRRDLHRRAADKVHRVLQGARPGDLPIEPPTRFELVINLRTARMLGLTIPSSLLQRADHVVE
ncbi:MAG TPA: ABC transporter substrate-binding protein [Methylomirabilota bacterium]|nr:ABC transporter substrate-binding protein [Methylomirabilota bacterium]